MRSPLRPAAVFAPILLAFSVAACGNGTSPVGPNPGGGIHTAMLSFEYDGHRTGIFEVDTEFELSSNVMIHEDEAWAFSQYWNDQFIMAQYPRDDGWVDLLLCWVWGPRVTEPGTRDLDCFLEVGTSLTGRVWDDDQPVEHSYSAFFGGLREFDHSGVITFVTVTPQRLVGTFSITMHSDFQPSETIEVVEGTFDVPVVSDFFEF